MLPLFWSGERQLATLVLIGDNELIALAVDVDDLDLVVVLQVLAQLRDIDIHRPGVEVVVVDPNGLERIVALQDLVGVGAEQGQQLVLLGGELGLLLADGEQLLLGVEGEAADVVERTLLVLLTLHATQDSLDAHHELLHGEGLGDIVVGTQLEAFEDILLQRLGRQEDDRHLGVALTNLLSQRETVLLRHHHVEDADVVLLLEELTVANLAVRAQLTLEVLRLEVLAEQHSQILIILTQQNLQFLFHNSILV